MARHLLSISDLGAEGIADVLSLADSFAEVSARAIPKVPALRGKTVALLFYENSTRTRVSFETAAKRLSADTINVAVAASSVAKGETLRDTALTLQATGIDAFVLRHSSSGAPWQLRDWVDVSVINAGDGWHQHPTQALVDCYTITQRLGSVQGKRIAIVGDIVHSRVARSNVDAFSALGASVTVVAPPTLLPQHLEQWPVSVAHELDDVLEDLDVLYLLRMQRERQEDVLIPNLIEYTERYGLTTDRARRLGDEAIIMHPGPMNRGVEIAADLPEDPRSVVEEQVANGVVVRMAVLYSLLGSGVPLGQRTPSDPNHLEEVDDA